MVNTLETLADEIRLHGTSKEKVWDLVSKVYARGYDDCMRDQRKVTQRIRFRYNLLLKWLTQQLSQFVVYTKRKEYKDIIGGMLSISDNFCFENRLIAEYKPTKYTIEINGEEYDIDMAKDLVNSLPDVVGDFIQEETERLTNKGQNE